MPDRLTNFSGNAYGMDMPSNSRTSKTSSVTYCLWLIGPRKATRTSDDNHD